MFTVGATMVPGIATMSHQWMTELVCLGNIRAVSTALNPVTILKNVSLLENVAIVIRDIIHHCVEICDQKMIVEVRVPQCIMLVYVRLLTPFM